MSVGKPGLLSDFQDNQSYMMRPCFKNKQKTKTTKQNKIRDRQSGPQEAEAGQLGVLALTALGVLMRHIYKGVWEETRRKKKTNRKTCKQAGRQ